MKANKILLIIQTVLMYISIVMFYIPAFNILNNEDGSLSNALNAMLITGLVFGVLAFLLSLVIVILSIVSVFTKNNQDTTKFTMILKIVLIPWFIANFILWALMILGMLNPFLFIAIPFIMALSIFGTYVYMLCSSLNNLGFLLSSIKNRTIKVKPILIVGMVFHLFFCLDVIGSIFTYIACFCQNGKKRQIKSCQNG